MELRYRLVAFAATIVFSVGGMAQAPAGANGQCRDGSYSTAAKKAGACSGHKGVQTWYASSEAASAKPSTAAVQAPQSHPATPPTPAPAIPATPPPARTPKAAPVIAQAQAPGGGPGIVWVNSSTKVYHCPGTKFYGVTKSGKYMPEAAAKAEGDRADHGKVCTQ